jgi:hypothetical protein
MVEMRTGRTRSATPLAAVVTSPATIGRATTSTDTTWHGKTRGRFPAVKMRFARENPGEI